MSTRSDCKKDELDRFYTKPQIAKECIDIFINCCGKDFLFIEPSAGNGSFSKQLDSCIAYDIASDENSIICQDWFTVNINDFPSERKKVAIGNPPFGSYNQLSIKFFDSCSFCDFIAFILPISFEKDNIQRRLNRHFFLIKSSILPKNSFLFQGQDYDVSCVFQIWKKRNAIRSIDKKKTTSPFFDFTKDRQKASCSLRRVGAKAGIASLNKNYQLESNYFLINKTKMSDEQFVNFINSIHYNAYGIGPKSLSKAEFIQKFENKIKGEI